MTSKREFSCQKMSDALYRPCKALPVHLICSITKRPWDARQPLRNAPSFFSSLRIGLKGCQTSPGHYLHSLERFPEAAAAYEAAATACAPACAPSGARRAAKLYRGLALLSTGAPADLEAACSLLHQRTGADAADSTSQVTL